jgi:hypothetical protein
LNAAPVQGFSRSIKEPLACPIAARRDEPSAQGMTRATLHSRAYSHYQPRLCGYCFSLHD